MNINGELFPYEQPKHGNSDTRVYHQHFYLCMTPYMTQEQADEINAIHNADKLEKHPIVVADPADLMVKKLKAQKVKDIREMAEEKVLADNPDYQELTSYGTRKKGYWAKVNQQVEKTLFWISNNQPGSITFIANKVDGIKTSENTFSEPGSLFNKIQMYIQNGITVQIAIPETGYTCQVPPAANRKLVTVLNVEFQVEKAWKYLYPATAILIEQLKKGDKTPVIIPEEDKISGCEAFVDEFNKGQLEFVNLMRDKLARLNDYRQAIESSIWTNVSLTLQPFINEWKVQNSLTAPTRMGYALYSSTAEILDKYNQDLKVPAANQLTLDDLKDPAIYDEMIRSIKTYASAYGISIKTEGSSPDTMTFTAEHWMRKPAGVKELPASMVMKQHARAIQALNPDTLTDMLSAYIQIDWYNSQPNPEEFYVAGYMKCECGKPIREITTHYYDYSTDKLLNMDDYVQYEFQYEHALFGTSRISPASPVTVCPYCGHIHDAEDFELVEPMSYEALAYKLDRDEE